MGKGIKDPRQGSPEKWQERFPEAWECMMDSTTTKGLKNPGHSAREELTNLLSAFLITELKS